jgi:hypothetical protein
MSTPLTVEQVAALAAQLSPTDRLRLVERIVHDLAALPDMGGSAGRSWREIRGLVAYPMCGEDAQAWVSRTRREGEQREQ